MGIFQEDEEIRVSKLIKLWVAEGFLKPVDGKILEEVAMEYFIELVDRNLILVERFGTSGNIKLCKVHDILRDLCLREAQKQKFICVFQRYVSTLSDINRLQANFYWNLQTLCTGGRFGMDFEFWAKHLLRHVKLVSYSFPDPPNGHIVLENLQTLSGVGISECREKVFEGIPNLKTLKVICLGTERKSLHCFSNLGHLRKLEHLKCFIRPFKEVFKRELQKNIAFPRSLKKLTLLGSRLNWEDITAKIGALPHLQVLKLEIDAASGHDWVTVEGQFCSLKFLLIENCDLVNWTTDETHFPRLEHLRLKILDKLTEIPSSIGEIPTLQSIESFFCSKSAAMSAKRIQEEQEELGNEGLRVYIKLARYEAY